ncbi:MAG: type II secretion system protein GspM [Pacificimonas sp.]|jgi:hypothetical protein|nr:type II secretion system protein GspM [Pacificimonas sp.]
MIAGLKVRWQGYSLRERSLLALLAALSLLALLWLLLVDPVLDWRSAARTDYQERLTDYAEADVLLGRLGAGGLNGADDVGATLERFGLAAELQSGPDGTTARIPAARADILFSALSALERSGVVVRSAEIRANADDTLSATLVVARAE